MSFLSLTLISFAALLVNVTTIISSGIIFCSLTSHATLEVSTRVFPEPGGAEMDKAPLAGWVAAAY